MVSPTHYVQTVDLSFHVVTCIEAQLPGEQIARDKEDIVMADLLCVVFQIKYSHKFLIKHSEYSGRWKCFGFRPECPQTTEI